jgi:hypothetical protein
MQNERMNKALKCSLHMISEVIMASKTYGVTITIHEMGLARHHKANGKKISHKSDMIIETINLQSVPRTEGHNLKVIIR